MIIAFADKATEVLYRYGTSAKFPPEVVQRALIKLEYLDGLKSIKNVLQQPGGFRFHSLGGTRKGQYSISVNRQWRICFRFVDGNAYDVELCDYH